MCFLSKKELHQLGLCNLWPYPKESGRVSPEPSDAMFGQVPRAGKWLKSHPVAWLFKWKVKIKLSKHKSLLMTLGRHLAKEMKGNESDFVNQKDGFVEYKQICMLIQRNSILILACWLNIVLTNCIYFMCPAFHKSKYLSEYSTFYTGV